MDGFEAARIVFSRIQKLVEDAEIASKIIGLLLLKDHGDQEMIRLACSPESHLHSVILTLKSHLALSSSSASSLTSPPFQKLSNQFSSDDLVDESHLSFLDDVDQSNANPVSRRSYSVSDVMALGHLEGEEAAGLNAWKQCMYFTRGFCKNGAACRFLHHDLDGVNTAPAAVDIMEHRQQLFRSKSFNPSLAAAAVSPPGSTYLTDKYMNFMMQTQLAGSPRSMFIGDDLLDLSQTGFERSHFHMNGTMDMMNPGSRQIYLTFPADSSFREEDVSNYFSIYGPVQDVRIPYQQKRMFGFVTFVYPETVKIILAKGNPHFVCDARVLVKPYKEKGKVPDRYRNMQSLNRGDQFMCNSPTGLGPRDPFNNQAIGPGMLSNQDILWRRKLEEHADLQQVLERQSQRLMDIQLLDVNRQNHQRAFSLGGMAIPSPTHAGSYLNRSFTSSSASSSPESTDGNFYPPQNGTPPTYEAERQLLRQLSFGASKEGMQNHNFGNLVFSGNDSLVLSENGDVQECVDPEHYLPESLFASPGEVAVSTSADTKSSNEIEKVTIPGGPIPTAFSASKNLTRSFNQAASTLEMAKSCYLQLPRLSASHGAIEM